jgi:hypothetical protein
MPHHVAANPQWETVLIVQTAHLRREANAFLNYLPKLASCLFPTATFRRLAVECVVKYIWEAEDVDAEACYGFVREVRRTLGKRSFHVGMALDVVADSSRPVSMVFGRVGKRKTALSVQSKAQDLDEAHHPAVVTSNKVVCVCQQLNIGQNLHSSPVRPPPFALLPLLDFQIQRIHLQNLTQYDVHLYLVYLARLG